MNIAVFLHCVAMSLISTRCNRSWRKRVVTCQYEGDESKQRVAAEPTDEARKDYVPAVIVDALHNNRLRLIATDHNHLLLLLRLLWWRWCGVRRRWLIVSVVLSVWTRSSWRRWILLRWIWCRSWSRNSWILNWCKLNSGRWIFGGLQVSFVIHASRFNCVAILLIRETPKHVFVVNIIFSILLIIHTHLAVRNTYKDSKDLTMNIAKSQKYPINMYIPGGP